MLVTGTAPTAKAPIFTAPAGGAELTSITLVNQDTGTTYATINLYVKPQNGSSIEIIPVNYRLQNGEHIVEDTVRHLLSGDQVELSCSSGSAVVYTLVVR